MKSIPHFYFNPRKYSVPKYLHNQLFAAKYRKLESLLVTVALLQQMNERLPCFKLIIFNEMLKNNQCMTYVSFAAYRKLELWWYAKENRVVVVIVTVVLDIADTVFKLSGNVLQSTFMFILVFNWFSVINLPTLCKYLYHDIRSLLVYLVVWPFCIFCSELSLDA